MARSEVIVHFEYDDVTDEVFMLIDMPAPAPPAGYESVWSSVSGAVWLVETFGVKDKNLSAVPVATYLVQPPRPEGDPQLPPPQRWQVEYRNGAWQMPGIRLW